MHLHTHNVASCRGSPSGPTACVLRRRPLASKRISLPTERDGASAAAVGEHGSAARREEGERSNEGERRGGSPGGGGGEPPERRGADPRCPDDPNERLRRRPWPSARKDRLEDADDVGDGGCGSALSEASPRGF